MVLKTHPKQWRTSRAPLNPLFKNGQSMSQVWLCLEEAVQHKPVISQRSSQELKDKCMSKWHFKISRIYSKVVFFGTQIRIAPLLLEATGPYLF